ncbi:MAG: ribonuclease R, partial [Tissierellia bacterium]|nr:ribonuclease R [Tissierellia bacterium]
MAIKDEIEKLMGEKKYKPLLREELAQKFGIGKKEYKEFFSVLDDLEKEGIILKAANNRYGLLNDEYLVVGKLESHEKGFGFVISKDRIGEDVYIPADSMNTAMHGDKVVANLIVRKEIGKRQEGEIIRI